MDDYEYSFNILLIGSPITGKSSVVHRFIDGSFSQLMVSKIGVDFKIKILNIKGVNVKLQIFDTPSQEKYQGIIQHYYRKTHCCVLFYDITQPSIDSLSYLCKEIEQYTGSFKNGDRNNVLKVLVGNKCDLVETRRIPSHIAKLFAHNNEFDLFMETSAKYGDNVQKLFSEIAALLVQKHKSPKGSSAINYISSNFNNDSNKTN